MNIKKKTKVCILQNGLARGGTDTFVVNLCKGIDKELFDLVVVNPSLNPANQIREPEIEKIGIPIIHTSTLENGIISKIKHFWKLFIILRKGKFDVFQTNIDLMNGPHMLIAWLARVPIRICHSHNSLQLKELKEGRTLPVKIYQRIMRWLCWRFSNRRTGCSVLAMDFLFKGKNWRNDKYSYVIYNGIDISQFQTITNSKDKCQEIGINRKYNILTVGRMHEQKNPMFIVDIISELCKFRDDVDMVWIGQGALREQIEKRISDLKLEDRFHILGERNDVNEIMQCCDAYIMPSNFEGLGIVIIEAQAANLPCLISDVIPDMVNCGGCMKLSLDIPAKVWAQYLNDILEKKIKLKVNSDTLNNFSILNMVKQMSEVFNS